MASELLLVCATQAAEAASTTPAQAPASSDNPGRTGAGSATSDDEFCQRAQRTMAGTTMTSRNVVHADYESFKKSKATIRPLQTEQFVLYEDAARTRPLRISCKLKSPDLFVATYGPAAARDPGLTCVDLNRQTVAAVYASLGAGVRPRIARERIVFDPDDTTFMGSSWIEPFVFAYPEADGTLHLVAKSLRIDWDNFWFAWAPDRVRGVIYCHLIAPEYLRRLIL